MADRHRLRIDEDRDFLPAVRELVQHFRLRAVHLGKVYAKGGWFTPAQGNGGFRELKVHGRPRTAEQRQPADMWSGRIRRELQAITGKRG